MSDGPSYQEAGTNRAGTCIDAETFWLHGQAPKARSGWRIRALTLAGAALVGGTALAASAAVGKRLCDERHEALEAQIHHGGILLWVRLHEAGQDATACEILRRHGGRNVHLHDVPTSG